MDLAKIEFLFQLHGYKVYVPERENRCYYYVGIEYVYGSSVDILFQYIPGWIELNFQDISDAVSHKRKDQYALKYLIWRFRQRSSYY